MIAMNDNIAIEVKDVSKSFKLPLERASSLKQAIFNAVSGKRGTKNIRFYVIFPLKSTKEILSES